MKLLLILLLLTGVCAAMSLPEFAEKYLTPFSGGDPNDPATALWGLSDFALFVCPHYGPSQTTITMTATTTTRRWGGRPLTSYDETTSISHHYMGRQPPNRRWYVLPKPKPVVKPAALPDPNSIDDPMLRALVKKLLETEQ